MGLGCAIAALGIAGENWASSSGAQREFCLGSPRMLQRTVSHVTLKEARPGTWL